MTRFTSWFSLARSQRGSAMPFIALGIFSIVGATGTAVDMGRMQIVQSRMQNALDAAGLAAGATVSTTDVSATVNKYFYANFPASYLGTTINTLTAVPTEDKSKINLAATGTVNTTFMKIFGMTTMNVSAASQITRQSKGMELVMVLDVTGSMTNAAGGGLTRIQALKSAAGSLLDILYGTNSSISNLWVGVVPFSQAVNIGTGRSAWTTTATLNWGPSPSAWGGCVEARAVSGRDVTDDPPSVELFPKYHWTCDTNNKWYGTNSSHNNCTASGSGFQYLSPLDTVTRGPNYWCPPAVTPLTAAKSTVVTAINALTAQGGTETTLGLAWGWRMLSPRWRTLWGGEMNTNSLPLDYNAPLMNKVVVLMSDGDNDIVTGWYSAYRYPSDGQLGPNACNASDCLTGEGVLNSRTTQICNSMKANGVLIYSVAFSSSISATGQALLKGCASKPEYYFYSPTGADLQNSFKMIGDALANLRVSQ